MTLPRLTSRALWLAAFVVLAGCRGEAPPPVELPLPHFAADEPVLGSMRSEARSARRDLLTHLSPEYIVTEDYIVHSAMVDSSVTWDEIEPFYDNEFRQAPLATSGFVRREMSSPEPGRYEFALWLRPGRRVGLRAGDDEVIVVLFLRPLRGSRIGVLQWLHLYDERAEGYPRRYINL